MDGSDCPTTPREGQWEQNETIVDGHSRREPAASIVKPEEESDIEPTVVPGKSKSTFGANKSNYLKWRAEYGQFFSPGL